MYVYKVCVYINVYIYICIMFGLYATTCCTMSDWECRGNLAPYAVVKITGLKPLNQAGDFMQHVHLVLCL